MNLSDSIPEITDVTRFIALAESLLMIESSFVEGLRGNIVKAMLNPDDENVARELYGQYERNLEMMADNLPGVKGQIGAQLLKAAIFREAGNEVMCDDFLYDAIVDAAQAGMDQLANEIRTLRVN
jgi:hypothetical protein